MLKSILICLLSRLTNMDANAFVQVSGIWCLSVSFSVWQEILVIWSISLQIIIFVLAKYFQDVERLGFLFFSVIDVLWTLHIFCYQYAKSINNCLLETVDEVYCDTHKGTSLLTLQISRISVVIFVIYFNCQFAPVVQIQLEK